MSDFNKKYGYLYDTSTRRYYLRALPISVLEAKFNVLHQSWSGSPFGCKVSRELQQILDEKFDFNLTLLEKGSSDPWFEKICAFAELWENSRTRKIAELIYL